MSVWSTATPQTPISKIISNYLFDKLTSVTQFIQRWKLFIKMNILLSERIVLLLIDTNLYEHFEKCLDYINRCTHKFYPNFQKK